jgi:ribosomal protein S4
MPLNRNIKKLTSGNVIIIDLDRKKDLLNQVYRNLYMKNWEVDRTLSSYQSKLYEKNKIDYVPQAPRKRDNFCDGYNIDF